TVSLTEEVDLTQVPGVGENTAADLRAAGFTSLQQLLDVTAEDLQKIEGVGPKTAASILNWAQERASHAEDGEPVMVEAGEETAATPTLQDDDFLAALSRAFKESEEKSRVAEQMTAEAEADAAAQAETGAET